MPRPELLEGRQITIIGGGGGGSAMVETFLDSPYTDVSAIVCMSDNGSSTGKLAEQYGTLPVGDIRRNIGAAAVNVTLSNALNHRFNVDDTVDSVIEKNQKLASVASATSPKFDGELMEHAARKAVEVAENIDGSLGGHAHGNLMLTGLAVSDGLDSAIETVSTIVGARARVVPATTTPHTLIMRDGGSIILGEKNIDNHTIQNPDDVEVYLSPKQTDGVQTRVPIYKDADERIVNSDLVVISPGSPHTSIAPVLKTDGITSSLQRQQENGGKIIGIANLLNNPHDTANWCVGRYAEFIQSLLGKDVSLDAIIYNTDHKSLPRPQDAVRLDREVIRKLGLPTRTVPARLVGRRPIQSANDTVRRSDVRHSTEAVARATDRTQRMLAAA